MLTNSTTQRVKLTKKALNNFIKWSTTRYNDWLDYGTKKQNVEKVYQALTDGNYHGRFTFTIESASPSGETYSGKNFRNWKISTTGSKYTINCIDKSITNDHTREIIHFI